jgi:hypothetical protein
MHIYLFAGWFFEQSSHYFAQSGLKLLDPSDLPTQAAK